ncbi:hypothetical protein [Salegentibacter maritimus]|uniref:hypothetical protein n=1 Tax=Salegentibacter maritimus TaxID=2794347 RepID=UPI0018E4631C|nr:hypothetical protein [Salegentibacter maritimus]MBI6117257.1 hypothetical protein [Salegentibacter maritimus]
MKALTNIGIYPTKNVQGQKTLQQIINEVLPILLKQVSLEAIYCFSFESHFNTKENIFQENYQLKTRWQLNLLLIGENHPNATADLADIIYQHTEGEVSLLLLCYTRKQIAQANNRHKHLFAKISRSGWLVYGKPQELAPLKLVNLPDLDYKGIITYSENRLNIAESLLKNTTLFFDQPLVAAYMFRLVVEQLCLGVLYAFIHYHPKQFHIQYLLQLCRNCCGLEDKIPVILFEQQWYNKLLKTSTSDLRFRSTDIFTSGEIKAAYAYCAEFLDQLTPAIHNQLQTLKLKDYEK